MNRPIITTLDICCTNCPSEWLCYTADPDQQYYIRYRWGLLRVDLWSGGECRTLFYEKVGESLDGVMDTPTMIGHVSALLDFSVMESYVNN